MSQTDEQRDDEIAALVREKEGYARRGLDDRVAEVQKILARLTRDPKSPAKRATRMIAPSEKRTEL